MALKSKQLDVLIPDNVSWPQYVFRHFDKYGDKTAIVSTAFTYSAFKQIIDLNRSSCVFELRFEGRSQRDNIETT